MSDSRAYEANLRLYPWYIACRETYFWMPVFFLYFCAYLPLDSVLLLEAVYYICVVILEVPSGYASDRFGRRRTLLFSSVAFLVSYACFFLAQGSHALFFLGQVFLAVGISFNSGTDTSFHYENLKELGKEEEYEEREARIERIGKWSSGLGALFGGGAAFWGLHWAYGLSFVAALPMLALAFSMRSVDVEHTRRSIREQLKACFGVWRTHSWLRWFSAVALVSIVGAHVPYEFYQPYLSLLTPASERGDTQWAALVSGLHVTAVAFVSGVFAIFSVRWCARLGRRTYFLSVLCVQCVLILAMGIFLHPLIVLLLVFRGSASALLHAPLGAAVNPYLSNELRATYLSLQSLSGRLAYGCLLLVLSGWITLQNASQNTWNALSSTIMVSLFFFGCCVLLLWSIRVKEEALG